MSKLPREVQITFSNGKAYWYNLDDYASCPALEEHLGAECDRMHDDESQSSRPTWKVTEHSNLGLPYDNVNLDDIWQAYLLCCDHEHAEAVIAYCGNVVDAKWRLELEPEHFPNEACWAEYRILYLGDVPRSLLRYIDLAAYARDEERDGAVTFIPVPGGVLACTP